MTAGEWAVTYWAGAKTLEELNVLRQRIDSPFTGSGRYYATRTGFAKAEIDVAYRRRTIELTEKSARATTTPTVGDAVQFLWEPNTGGVITSTDGTNVVVATSNGDRTLPADCVRLVRPEHVTRVRKSVGL